MTPAELRIRQIPHDRWSTTDTRRHINNGTYPSFLGRLRLSFFRGRGVDRGGGLSPCSACRSWIAFALLPLSVCRLAYRLPVLAFLLAFFCPFSLSPCVCPSVWISCDFAPFPCVFLAVSCLALRCPFRPFHFNALFRRFLARFGSVCAIYRGNKKSPF